MAPFRVTFVLYCVSIKQWVSICWRGVVSWWMGWGLGMYWKVIGFITMFVGAAEFGRTKAAVWRRHLLQKLVSVDLQHGWLLSASISHTALFTCPAAGSRVTEQWGCDVLTWPPSPSRPSDVFLFFLTIKGTFYFCQFKVLKLIGVKWWSYFGQREPCNVACGYGHLNL